MVVSRELGQRLIHMPRLTQMLGALLPPATRDSYVANLSSKMEILSELVKAIPRFSLFSMNFHYNFRNWLPFYWAGYRQTTRYTYVIADLTDLDAVFQGFSKRAKQHVRRARRLGVTVQRSENLEDFLELHEMTFARQSLSMPYTRAFVEALDAACASRRARAIHVARDAQGRKHVATYVVHDRKSAYLISSGGNPELRSSGAKYLAVWEAIKFCSTVSKRFDFEGSCKRNLEQHVRAFGGTQMPYFNISKDNRTAFLRGCLAIRRRAGLMLRAFGFRR